MELDDIKIIKHYNKGFPRGKDVPEKPGLYAWYYDFSHLEMYIDNEKLFNKRIKEAMEHLKYPCLSGELKGHLSLQYSGSISHNPWDSTYDKKGTFSSFASRKSFLDIISKLYLIGNPLYVGITKRTLRQRYNEHIKNYEDSNSIDIDEGKNLGERLCERGIHPKYLIFVCCPLDNINLTGSLKDVETLINRLFHPILGRR